MSQYFR